MAAQTVTTVSTGQDDLDSIAAVVKSLARRRDESVLAAMKHDSPSAEDEARRKALLAEAQKLVQSLERPQEAAFRLVFESHSHVFCIRAAIDLRIFHILSSLPTDTTISATELAAQTGAEHLLLVRILRVITAIGYASERGPQVYAATPLSRVMTDARIEAHAVHSHEYAARIVTRLPAWLASHGWRCPTDAANGPFQSALGTDLSFFQHLDADPVRRRRFDTAMTGNKGARRHWFEWFPVDEALQLERFRPTKTDDDVFLVDMGGGNGYHLRAFLRAHPQLDGHLVLQDLGPTIEAAMAATDPPLPTGIRAMVHDAFGPQTVRGARAYYTHFFLHDFPDAACQTLLRQVATAMAKTTHKPEPGEEEATGSRILLNEIVLPEEGCPSFFAAADITMMACLAGMQRSEAQWRHLVDGAGVPGLRIRKVWRSPDPGDFEGVVELELVESGDESAAVALEKGSETAQSC